MQRRLLPLLLLLLLTQFAFAQERPVVERFYTDPPVVYENEPFDIVVGGFFPGIVPPKPVITGTGAVRIIELPGSPGGPLISLPWGERIRIDGMLPGTYTYRVRALGAIQQAIQVVVHPKPFTLAPRFGLVGEDEVIIEDFPDPVCIASPCFPFTVSFGSEQARIRFEQRPGGKRVIVAEVPEGTGVVDVHLTVPTNVRFTLPMAFRFGAKGTEGDYERVLFPSNFAARGAHGSDWNTDIIIRNDAPIRVHTEPLFSFELLLPDLQAYVPISPGTRARFFTVNRDGGAFLHVARGLDKWLTYASRAYDRSRSTTDRGTEVPVVRADDTASEIRLVDVPMRSLFRSHLRIYDFDDVRNQSVEVVIRKEDGTEMVIGVQMPSSSICVNPPCLPDRPSFHSIDLSALEGLADAGEVDITVRAMTHDRRLWAFVSVANNETQRVTIYTPQHKTPAGVIR
jgi:hypothetical protein